jgi:hypothetical protein
MAAAVGMALVAVNDMLAVAVGQQQSLWVTCCSVKIDVAKFVMPSW